MDKIYKLYDYFFKSYDRTSIQKANVVLCNSHYSRDYIYKVYKISAKVNYLGVDVDRYKPLDVVRENMVISIGHLEIRKGHEFVIMALARVSSEIRPRLVITYLIDSDSEREYKKYLQKLCDDNDVKVSFIKRMDEENFIMLYNRAKLTLCAYLREPFGLVPLESMACATPVVAIKEAGLKESIISNQTGILVDRDIAQFSQAIEYLLKNNDLRIGMGVNGRKYVLRNWTWENSVRELENNLSSVIKK
jgi:glycosyltransferase involved in cell wall biosynthesis